MMIVRPRFYVLRKVTARVREICLQQIPGSFDNVIMNLAAGQNFCFFQFLAWVIFYGYSRIIESIGNKGKRKGGRKSSN